MNRALDYFENRFYTVLNDSGKWRAKAGRVESVDLRFAGEAVVLVPSLSPATSLSTVSTAAN